MRRGAAAAGAVALAVAVIPAGAQAASAARGARDTVSVRLSDFRITPSAPRAKAGKVTFVVRNVTSIPHEMVVIRTRMPAGGLPMSNGRAVEKGSLGETGDLAGGRTKTITLTLGRGHYALICNVPGHYMSGMHANFSVS
jgi:uncharacterized cupredoxin-like copper-binding protein